MYRETLNFDEFIASPNVQDEVFTKPRPGDGVFKDPVSETWGSSSREPSPSKLEGSSALVSLIAGIASLAATVIAVVPNSSQVLKPVKANNGSRLSLADEINRLEILIKEVKHG